MTFSALRAGSRVGSYNLERCTGSGACGEVWRASNGTRPVAVKFINADLLAGADAARHLQRLHREAGILERLGDHPNIPSLLGRDLECDRPYVVMQHVSGPAWSDLIASGEILCIPIRRRIALLQTVARALRVVHLAGYLHRDIKPSNIHGVDTPYLLDFSVAIDKRDVTADGRRVGTRLYMPPHDGAAPDERDDTFALALVAYEVLFGRHAFGQPVSESDPTEVLAADGSVPVPAWQRPGSMADHELPQALRGANLSRLDAVFSRALGNRLLRYRSATMLVQHLEEAILVPSNEPFLDYVPDVAVALSISTEQQDDFTIDEVRSLVEQAEIHDGIKANAGAPPWKLLVVTPVAVMALAALALVIVGG